MAISLEEVQHVAKLARLELEEPELVAFQGELNALLGHFEDLQHIALMPLENLSDESDDAHRVWEDDTPRAGLPREAALRNGALTRAGLFVVPTIIEE